MNENAKPELLIFLLGALIGIALLIALLELTDADERAWSYELCTQWEYAKVVKVDDTRYCLGAEGSTMPVWSDDKWLVVPIGALGQGYR